MTNPETVSERMAASFAALSLADLPDKARETGINDLIDMAGLCIAARKTDYLAKIIDGCDADGPCTAIGQSRGLDAAGAAIVNGVATHGEDFDDTLEGAPIRVGAMVIPAVLAACERFERSGADALLGIVCGLEAICRFNHIAPGAIHHAGFHPVGVIGALGGTVGASVALGLNKHQMTMALGIAGSLASGILEYLTDGAARHFGAGRITSPRARSSKGATISSRPSRRRARNRATISRPGPWARNGSWKRSPSSPMPAAP
jgi:2-methylcitrate dehydratase PrpD